MFENLQNIELFPVSASEVILNISVALICSLLIGRLYKHVHRGPGYSVNFVHSLTMLAMITALVIMVVGNSLARAFGLVGTLSIIRFRTAIKDTHDIVYVFFCLSIGLAAGSGFHRLAFVGTLFIGTVLFVMAEMKGFDGKAREYLLQFTCRAGDAQSAAYAAVFKEYCKQHRVINVKSLEAQDAVEMSYYVRFRDKGKNGDFVRSLQQIPGIKDINLFFDEESI
jgi:hypothetical protein